MADETIPIDEPPPLEEPTDADTALGVVLREGALSPRKALTGLLGVVLVVGGAVLWLTDPRGKRQVKADSLLATASAVEAEALGKRFSIYEAVSKASSKEAPGGDLPAGDATGPGEASGKASREQARDAHSETLELPTPAPAPVRDAAYFRARSLGSTFVPAMARKAPTEGRAAGPTVVAPRVVIVPRGTRMMGFLESTIRTDNLDSRLIVRLMEDLVLGGRVILPAGGELIGEVDTVRSRYQDRVSAHVTSYKYPTGMHEQKLDGLLMDANLAAHLPADDRVHHTKGLIWGTLGLAVAGAVSGSYGSAHGEEFGEIAGAGAVRGFTSLAERNLEHFTQVMPTLLVEPRAVVVWVDETFEALAYDDVVNGAPAPASTAPAGEKLGPPDLAGMLAHFQEIQRSLPTPGTGLPLPMGTMGTGGRGAR